MCNNKREFSLNTAKLEKLHFSQNERIFCARYFFLQQRPLLKFFRPRNSIKFSHKWQIGLGIIIRGNFWLTVDKYFQRFSAIFRCLIHKKKCIIIFCLQTLCDFSLPLTVISSFLYPSLFPFITVWKVDTPRWQKHWGWNESSRN